MRNYYVPYQGAQPATVSVNGHKVIVLSRRQRLIAPYLTMLGAESVRRLQIEKQSDEEQAFEQLANASGAGVVITPSDLELPELLRTLEAQLPWVQ